MGIPSTPALRSRATGPAAPAAEPLAGKHAVTVYVPVRTVSEANTHDHWRKRHARAKAQRGAIALKFTRLPLPAPPLVVRLERIAGRRLDDDNLRSAFKAIRDEVAKFIGVDDGDERVKWEYDQWDHPNLRGHVRIHIAPAAAGGANG